LQNKTKDGYVDGLADDHSLGRYRKPVSEGERDRKRREVKGEAESMDTREGNTLGGNTSRLQDKTKDGYREGLALIARAAIVNP
jgi:hypothetical protein